MKKWILKAIVQKSISFLPWRNNINYLFQKYVTKGVYLTDAYFGDRLGHAVSHMDAYRKHTANPSDRPVCLELGTGWYPVVPIVFFLSGAEVTYSVDISFLTSKERIATTIDKFLEWHENGQLSQYLQYSPDQMEHLRSIREQIEGSELETLTGQLRIKYLVADARNLPFEDDSIDLVNSNNTFEHIYPGILTPILKEFKRVVKKNGEGIQSHFIDMSDHFAHFDKTINIYNFLQFSEKEWAWIDNPIQPQSRLRIDDYREIYKALDIPITEELNRPGDIEALQSIDLDKQFAAKPAEVAAISHCHFVSVM